MTAKAFVKNHYPNARAVRYKTNNVFDKKGYWLCWTTLKREQSLKLSEGTSESNAWVNAKKNIVESLSEKQ